MPDRELQDEIIRYLADASVRRHPSSGLVLAGAEAAKAGKFARFLARRYYRDRLFRSFRYSRGFAAQTRRRADEVVESPKFENFLGECSLGSLESARKVGEMAVVHLSGASPGAWWRDLLDYEYAHFLQTATSEQVKKVRVPHRGVSALSRQFNWSMPAVLERLRAGKQVENDLQRPVTLLFSRTSTGRVYVVEIDKDLSAVFRSANGLRRTPEIASAAGVSEERCGELLRSLEGIGAVVMPS